MMSTHRSTGIMLAVSFVGVFASGQGPALHRSSTSAPVVRSYVLAATEEIWPAQGYSGLAGDTGPVRIEIRQWYASSNRWRMQRSYLTPPRERGLMESFLSGPALILRNGATYLTYDAYRHTLSRQRVPSRQPICPGSSPSVFEAGGVGSPGPSGALEGVTDVRSLMRRLSSCDTAALVPTGRPKLVGSATVAGHAAYVVDFGLKPCGWNSASAHEVMGRRIIWVDKQTFFLLKSVLYSVYHPRQIFKRVIVTLLRYNLPIAPRRFVFTPPRGVQYEASRPGPVTTLTSGSLRTIRRQVPFPVFVPTRVPYGLRPRQPALDGDGHVSIEYRSGSRRMNVLEGAVGCCLDADPRKYGRPMPLPSGRRAYLLDVGPQLGGLILWWDQVGAYIALSSPDLTPADLRSVAASMSRTAGLSP